MENYTLKKFNALGSVFLHTYEAGMIIKNLHDKGEIKLVEGKYHNEWENSYKKFNEDVKLLKTWSTFSNCVDIVLTKQDGTILVNVIIFDGDPYDGIRQTWRWMATFSGFPESELIKFESSIDYQFRNMLIDTYEEELLTARAIRIKQLENEYLNS